MNRFAIVVQENTTADDVHIFIEQQMIVTVNDFDFNPVHSILLIVTELNFAFDDIVDISFMMQAAYVEWVKR